MIVLYISFYILIGKSDTIYGKKHHKTGTKICKIEYSDRIWSFAFDPSYVKTKNSTILFLIISWKYLPLYRGPFLLAQGEHTDYPD